MKSLNVNLYHCSFLRGNKLCRLCSEMQRLSLRRIYNKAASVCECCTIANSRNSPTLSINASPSFDRTRPFNIKKQTTHFSFPKVSYLKAQGSELNTAVRENESSSEWDLPSEVYMGPCQVRSWLISPMAF